MTASPSIRYGDVVCRLEPGESVLAGLERCGVAVPSSCRSGVCQSCLLQATSGAVPPAAQNGLKDTWRQRGYFLACVCHPGADLAVAPIGAGEDVPARIVATERLSTTVTRLLLRPGARSDGGRFEYEPGQFVTLLRRDGLARSYSLASLTGEPHLELHVRHLEGGRMSTWIHAEAAAGEPVVLRGPHGECFYTAGQPERPLLLAGTGTGLAPLWGIAREALRQGHGGPITVLHGARDPGGLYLQDELAALARDHASVRYIPCVLARHGDADRPDGAGPRIGSIVDAVKDELERIEPVAAVRAYLCGDPGVVRTLKKTLFLAGVSLRDIFSDEFVTSARESFAGSGPPRPSPALAGLAGDSS